MMMIAVTMILVPAVLAESEAAPSVSVFHHFVVAGGWITWFVLVPLSVVAVALILQHLLLIRRGALVPVKTAHALMLTAKQGSISRLAEVARSSSSMLGQGVYAGLLQLSTGRDAARAATDAVIEDRAMKLLRRIDYLNVIGNISPMIGLMGTVVGMIQAFNRIYAAGGGMPEASKLVGDIAIALVNTFWGLLIAIPAMAAFAMLRNRVDGFAAEAARSSDAIITALVDARNRALAAEAAAQAKSAGHSEPLRAH